MNRAERRRKNRELIKANNLNVVEARHMATSMAASVLRKCLSALKSIGLCLVVARNDER